MAMKHTALIAAGLLSSALAAHAAETVILTGFTFNPLGSPGAPAADFSTNFITTIDVDASLPVSPPAASHLGAGQMSGFLNGNSFVTYCVQIDVPVGFGFTYTDYTLVAGASPAGFGSRAADLAKLMTWANAGGKPSNAADSAALQAAVWEIVHETTDGAYSFVAGKLETSSNSAATQAALNTIEGNWATIMAISPTYSVSRLDGANQDLLIFAALPVPEAGSLAMMVLGLMGVGVAVRKRHRN